MKVESFCNTDFDIWVKLRERKKHPAIDKFLPSLLFFYLDDLKNRLFERHTEDMERKSREHEAHLHAARMELERAVEISKQKVGGFH